MKSGNYKEDSTKGRALTMPVSYKGDAYVQVWLDSRMLATISEWLDKNGLITRFLSDVVKFTMEQVLEHIREKGEEDFIETTSVARDILSRKYRVNLNPRDRGKRNVLHNLILDSRKVGREVGEHGGSVSKDDEISKRSAEALANYNKMYGPKEENAEETRKRMLEVFDIDENGVCTIKNMSAKQTIINEEVIPEPVVNEVVKPTITVEKKKKEKYDPPRKRTEAEIRELEIEREKKDREYVAAIKNMPAASEIFKQNV